MNPISFFANGEPKGQPRPRAFAFHGRARVYDPGTAEGWKNQIAVAAKPFVPEKPLAGAVRVDLEFTFPRPKAHFRTGKRAGEVREDAPLFHTSKPDRDNCDKAVLDCLTVLGFFDDDAQVCAGQIVKFYGARPGCRITIGPALCVPEVKPTEAMYMDIYERQADLAARGVA